MVRKLLKLTAQHIHVVFVINCEKTENGTEVEFLGTTVVAGWVAGGCFCSNAHSLKSTARPALDGMVLKAIEARVALHVRVVY